MNVALVINLLLESNSSIPISWEKIPEYFWTQFAFGLRDLGVNRIGFGEFKTLEKLECAKFIKLLNLQPKNIINYRPFHGKILSQPIATCDFTDDAALALCNTRFHEWSLEDSIFNTDELAFFCDEKLFALVIPYEDIVVFYDVNPKLLDDIEKISPIFKGNIHFLNKKGKFEK